MINRKVYFDLVRNAPFNGTLTQQQVDGQSMILDRWEYDPATIDLRWLSYALATAMHETASTMYPIEEYGKGKGMKYGTPDPKTKQTYFGRGFVQLTWAENYQRATNELNLTDAEDIYWHAHMALDPKIAADVMFFGMVEGWFRTKEGKPETLGRYFNDQLTDPFNARGIINGDKNTVPKWSGGVSIGKLIEGYYDDFLYALKQATVDESVEVA